MFRRFAVILVAFILAASVLVAAPAHADSSPIDQRYWSDTALRNMLGQPTGSEYDVGDGAARSYQWGSLYWSPDTGVHEVHGAIRTRYHQLGGPSGFLGFPTSDEQGIYYSPDDQDERLGSRNDFEEGAITWSSSTGAKWMGDQIADVLPLHTWPIWGIPTNDEKPARNGRVLTLGGSARIYSTPTGIHVLHDGNPSGTNAILDKYLDLGGHDGWLKLPRTGGTVGNTEGIVQQFEGGDIFQCGYVIGDCGTDEAYAIRGAIRTRFFNEGGLGTLGYPISDELTVPGGKVSHFQNGSISWNSATGQTSVTWS